MKKRLESFGLDSSREDGHFPWCRLCKAAKAHAYYLANKHKQDSTRVSERHRLRKYGVDQAAFDRLLEAQDRHCAICSTRLGTGRDCHIDHCHDTGVVRGVLCQACNKGIGFLKDDPTRLRAAIRYLEANRDSS